MWAIGVGALLTVATLGGCGLLPGSQGDIGVLRTDGATTALAVPALWASGGSGEGQVGGIEPAEVLLTRNVDDAGYHVDLTTIEAKGAGPQWEAATAAAAAVATMSSGIDPASVSLGFTITGPIDGPSAGGILTVGLLASMNGHDLLPGATMTGTISPDGTIGPVGYVPTKLAAAKDAGFTTVAIPASLAIVSDGEGGTVSLVDYGQGLGLTVVPVQTLAEAYLTLTGEVLIPPVATPVGFEASTVSAIEATTSAMRMRLRALINSAPDGVNALERRYAAHSLASMADYIERQEWAEAYGVGAVAYLRFSREIGGVQAQARVDRVGVQAATQELVAEIKEALARANMVMAAAVATPGTTMEQQASLPQALSWVTYAIASYEGLLDELALASEAEALVRAARVLAEESAGVEAMFPDARAVVKAMGSSAPMKPEAMVALLDGYSEFLDRAGDANLAYADAVTGKKVVDGLVAGDGVIAAARVLSSQLSDPGTSTGLDEAIAQTARAVSYYDLTDGMVSGLQAYGVSSEDPNLDALKGSKQVVMDAAVDSGAAIAEASAERLKADGIDMSYPLWSARWAAAGAREYRDSVAAGQAAWIGLNELWVDAVTMSILDAAGQSLSTGQEVTSTS